MDDSTREDHLKSQVPRAADCDDLFFKFSLSVNYDIKEVESMFAAKQCELLSKPPRNSLMSQLGVDDKITYVKLVNSISDPQEVLCLNIAACRICQELFAYTNNQDILKFYRTHKCQTQFNIKVLRTYPSPRNNRKNKFNLQNVNGSSLSTKMYEPVGNINGNISSLQDVNRSDLSVYSIRQEDDTGLDLQNCENNEENAEDTEEAPDNINLMESDDENVESGTIVNILDGGVEVVDLENGENVAENSDDSVITVTEDNMTVTEKQKAMIGLCNKLDHPCVRTVVTDLYNYNLIVTMNEFYKTGRFTDATVVCENQKIECHRLVLSMFSAHFEEMFRECCMDHSVVAIEGLKFWQVKALIDYMYTSRVSVDESDWCLLMEAVDKLQFRDYLRPKKLPRDSTNKRLCT